MVEELLQNYCDNVIKEEIDIVSKPSLRELYKAALDYKREVIEQNFGDRTSDEQFEVIEKKIELLKRIGLQRSENCRALESELSERRLINEKYRTSECTKRYLEHVQSYFEGDGFLAMSFRQFAKALGGKYRMTLLPDYGGQVSEKEIQKLSRLYEACEAMSDDSYGEAPYALLNTIRKDGVTDFILNRDTYNYSAIAYIKEATYQSDPCLQDWLESENRLFRCSPIHLATLDELEDNDLFQLYIDNGNIRPQGDLVYVMDYPGTPDDVLIDHDTVQPTDFLIAIPKTKSPDYPPIVFQTFWDGVIVEAILGYDQLKMIDYSKNGLVVEEEG